VENKQQALDEARTDLTTKVDGFCRSATTYIGALDRCGDVLTGTAPTVGDVTEAGNDLAERRSDVIAGAEAAQEAKQAVATAEQELAAADDYQGEIDGVYGPTTVDAVSALQKKHGLPVTGTVDKATDAALRADLAAKGGAAASQEVASTAAVQQTLKLAGHWSGPVDGAWTPALTEALKAFQTELGVKPTGAVDAATVAAVQQKVNDAPKRASASPSASS
jgi:peptidoglycan hydrolase-like protein with peptidoglycan-binding domain